MHSTHRFTREEINHMLEESDNAVERAIIRLFTMQNEDEQRYATTNAQNGRGFGAADAKAGTRFARWLQGMDNKNVKCYQPKSLSNYKAERIFGRYCKDGESVLDRARRIALKHSQQLVDYANAECDRIDAETDKRIAALEEKVRVDKLNAKLQREKKYGKPLQSDVWYQNEPRKTGPMPLLISGLTQAEKDKMNEAPETKTPKGPPPGSWAATARMMAQGDDSGFDWDRWKDEMKERDL